MIKPRVTRFRLVGGLGNQLFILAAGRYLEEQLDHTIVFNQWFLKKVGESHDVTISGRGFEDEFVNHQPVLEKLTERVARRFKAFDQRYVAREDGWDPGLITLKRGLSVNGYFQTWRYASDLENRITRNDLLRSGGASVWLSEEVARAREERPIMLHVRRGDYVQLSSSFGLIGSDFFKAAISRLEAACITSQVWVFSDEVQAAAKIAQALDVPTRVIEPPAGTDPGESMALMSYGRANVISNSTFAWWGAFLNPEAEMVIAPSPWFQTIDTPRDLLPPYWVTLHHGFSGE